MPITPEQLKKLRNRVELSQQGAANSVLTSKRTWQNWEAKIGNTNHRVIPEPVLELFCIKNNIKYKTVDRKVLIDV